MVTHQAVSTLYVAFPFCYFSPILTYDSAPMSNSPRPSPTQHLIRVKTIPVLLALSFLVILQSVTPTGLLLRVAHKADRPILPRGILLQRAALYLCSLLVGA